MELSDGAALDRSHANRNRPRSRRHRQDRPSDPPRLRLHGTAVRAASRTSPTPFDWSAPSGWDVALAGAAAVYIVAPPTTGPAHEFVARAEAAGVQRLVLLSGRGADTWGTPRSGWTCATPRQLCEVRR